MFIKKLQLFALCMFVFQLPIMSQKSGVASWYINGYTEQTAMDYFNRSTMLEPIEGIWQSTDGFKYSIEKDVDDGKRVSGRYRVVVIDSSHDGWNVGHIKGFITQGSMESVYSFKYYTRSVYGTNTESQNVLLVIESPVVMSFARIDASGKVLMYRIYPKVENDGHGFNTNSNSYEQWSGSGIVIGDKYIVTNNHVVEGANTLVVTGVNGDMNTSYKVQAVVTDKNNDLAIVKVVDEKFNSFGMIPYGFRIGTVDVGTEIFVLGYPMTKIMGEEIKVTNGIISSKTGFQGDVSTYQMTAPIQPGNSGGPVFDYNGNLIGISVAGIRNDVAQNVNYAVKMNYLQNLIESCNEEIILSNENNISSFSLPDKIKIITPYVLMFKANNITETGTVKSTPDTKNENNKQEAEWLRQRAIEKYQNGDNIGAYNDIMESVRIYPTAENHYTRGIIVTTVNNDTSMAIESYKYCIEHNYNLEDCHIRLAECLCTIGKHNEAIEHCNMALVENKKSIRALYLRAFVKSSMNDKNGAIIDYMQVLKNEGIIDCDYGSIYNNIAYAYIELKDYSKANMYIKEALKRNTLEWYIWDTDGELAYKLGEYERCISSMNNAITIDGKQGNSYLYRGLAKVKLGNHTGAYHDAEILKVLDNSKPDTIISQIDMSLVDLSANIGNEQIIKNPIFKYISGGVKLKAIELTEEYTALYITLTKDPYDINVNALLKVKNVKYPLIKIEKADKNTDYVLYFPAIENAKTINYYEYGGDYGRIIEGLKLKSGGKVSSGIFWSDVVAVEDAGAVEGMIYVETITATSGWGNAAASIGINSCINTLKKKAASKGCSVILITNISSPWMTYVTAKLYRMP